MDDMLPSPGFSIPSIGTPMAHHAGEEEMILPSAAQQQQLSHHQQQIPQQHNTSMPPTMSSFSSGLTPHSLMQPHTPVSALPYLENSLKYLLLHRTVF